MLRFERVVGRPKSPKRKPVERDPAPPALQAPVASPQARGPAARPDHGHVKPASVLFVSLVFSVLIFGFFLLSERGFFEVRRQRRQLAGLQAEVSALAAENARLEAEIAALKDDPAAMEKLAREDLNFVKPGEVVLVLPEGWKSRVAPGAAPVPAPTLPPRR